MISMKGDLSFRKKPSLVAPVVVTLITFLLLVIFSIRFVYYVKTPNVDLGGKSFTYLYIPTGTDFQGLLMLLKDKSILKVQRSFIFTAHRKHYETRVKAGKYRIRDRMNNNELVNQLRLGQQEPVRLSFLTARTIEELAGRLGRQIEADSASFMRLFLDDSYLMQFGVDSRNVFALFIPNTYQIFWNTTAAQLIMKMDLEQKTFWNSKRRSSLASTDLSIPEAVTLASIVEKETNKDTEKPDIAGVYLNRLNKGWPLQADPTIIYAWHDFSIKRISSQHLKINSEYNTYSHKGLPPGPICIPSISSIDAVLNFRRHAYMYFCAKDDLSGYHNFATDLTGHMKNARNYQKALDRLNIR